MPAGVRLAIDHDQRLALLPLDLADWNQFEVEQINHRLVFGAADQAVAGHPRRNAKGRLDQMGQPHHAAEAVRVGVDMRNKSDRSHRSQAVQEAIRTPDDRCCFAVHGRFGALPRHGAQPSNRLGKHPPGTVQILRYPSAPAKWPSEKVVDSLGELTLLEETATRSAS